MPQPLHGGLACRLGRCFCFAEVSTGHPHLRNDEEGEKRIAARLTAYDGRVISAISQKPLKFRLNVIIFAIYNDNFNNFITKVLNV